MGVNWADPSYYPLAVFLCILGAGVGVCIAYAVAWQMGNTSTDGPDRFTIPNDQRQYMIEVRERNMQDMAAVVGVRYFVDEAPRMRGQAGEWDCGVGVADPR